ncbi:MAG: flavodoxin-dependent (E)-4-hydroxy-3-methylbut-2-enyl-diphosphate synthase [Deltaproteobacteria bacterium]|nr:flavodoxin-dependent (E)-4-hydroxy-3-methylbut-2-enyl-diphosphate synthase [Deltaproteobacteria bacterium]
MILRKKTKPVFIGPVQIGGDAPVVVQSMTCTDTRNIEQTLRQIITLADAGCEIVRVAVPDREAAASFGKIRERSPVPLIADIHFDYHLAIEAIKAGADGIRINPGNIKREMMKEIAHAAGDKGIAIRIGVNAGSVEKDILASYGGPTTQALVESAMRTVRFFEDLGFTALKLSVKSSDVATMVESYRALSNATEYPLHLGVTEAGGIVASAIKSSIGIGMLLYEGIGDTIRVSITGDPVHEVAVAYGILRALHVREVGPDIISCPTCGRCEFDVAGVLDEVEKRLSGMKTYMKIAIMGCPVNGPGEAAEADIGIAGGRGTGLLFKKGKVVKRLKDKELVETLIQEIRRISGE